jgi:hypothetical protein
MIRHIFNKINKINYTIKINKIDIIKRYCHHHYSSNVKMKNDEFYDKIGFEFVMKTEIDDLKFKTNSLQQKILKLEKKHSNTRLAFFIYLIFSIYIH